ncbi:hypothetical protein JNB11_04560 [Kocuria palustris]|nr:hypothetical protein [Kocuria palustris]
MAVPTKSCEISLDLLISLSPFLPDLKAREARTLISTQNYIKGQAMIVISVSYMIVVDISGENDG